MIHGYFYGKEVPLLTGLLFCFQESRPSTKDTKSSKRSEVKAKIPSRSPNRIVKEVRMPTLIFRTIGGRIRIKHFLSIYAHSRSRSQRSWDLDFNYSPGLKRWDYTGFGLSVIPSFH